MKRPYELCLDGPDDTEIVCTVTVVYFFPGSHGTYWDPPEGPEVDYSSKVKVRFEDGRTEEVEFDAFLELYQMSRHPTVTVDIEQARVNLDDEVIEALTEELSEPPDFIDGEG